MSAHFFERFVVRFFLVGFLVMFCEEGISQDVKQSWPRFLGANGESISSLALPTSWDESNYLWETDVPGSGWSSPVYADGKIWLSTSVTKPATAEQIAAAKKGSKNPDMVTTVGALSLYAVCVDLESGELLHNILLSDVEKPGASHPLNSYASPTPAISDGKVVLHFGTYGTWCLNAVTGKEIWKTDFVIDHGTGPGSSPAIHDGKVILPCDGVDQQFVAAVSLEDGTELWKTDRPPIRNVSGDRRKAFSTPLIVELAGKTQAIVPGAQWIISYNPENGQEYWRVDHGDGFSTTPTASVEGGLVIFPTSFIRSEFVAIDPSGSGDVSKSHVKWRAKQGPNLPSLVTSDGKVFSILDKGIMLCLDAKSGEMLGRVRIGGNFCASPLLADGKIYVCSREGKVTIVKADKTLKKVGKQTFADSRLMATPAPVGNDLLIRTDKKLYRIGKREK